MVVFSRAGAPNGTGVLGMANADGGPYTVGGYFVTFSDAGKGVYGHANSQKGEAIGGHFVSDSNQGIAVKGEAGSVGGHFSASTAHGTGVLGYANSENEGGVGGGFATFGKGGIGVSGSALSLTGGGFGGYFINQSSNGIALHAEATSEEGETYGGHFITYGSAGSALKAEAKSKVGGTYGGYFYAESGTGTAVYGQAAGVSGKAGHFISDGDKGIGVKGEAKGFLQLNYGVYGRTRSSKGYGVYSEGNMKCTGNQIVGKNLLVKGNQTVSGTKSAVVKIKNGEGVSLYAVEASENWFEDFGSAKLAQGATVVAIDPVYAETVNTEIDYHVFLTPRGECQGLYVMDQKNNSFEVRELGGGKSDIPFSYRIVAKRKGYEDVRLAKVEEETLTAMVTAEKDSQANEVMSMHGKVK